MVTKRALAALIVIATRGCTELNEEAGPHPDLWAAGHIQKIRAANYDLTTCRECHGAFVFQKAASGNARIYTDSVIAGNDLTMDWTGSLEGDNLCATCNGYPPHGPHAGNNLWLVSLFGSGGRSSQHQRYRKAYQRPTRLPMMAANPVQEGR